MTFIERYEKLERAFDRQVAKDYKELGIKSVFLPNIRPEGPVDFVLVAQEPSGGKGDTVKALEGIERGERNFSGSVEDFILHFCVQEYLCQGGKTYYLTDLAKGAMPTKFAGLNRNERYERWYPLLQRELRVVANPGMRVIPIGTKVDDFLKQKSLDWPLEERILHFAKPAAPHRGKASKCDPEGYRQFCSEVSLSRVEQAAKVVLAQAGTGKSLLNLKLNRLRGSSGLTDSRKKLMFGYKVAFERINGAMP